MTTRRRIICSILSLLLSSCSLVRPPLPERTVKVKILADSSVTKNDRRWLDEIDQKFAAAADFFEREFGIRLIADKIQSWPLERKVTSTVELLRDLKQHAPLSDKEDSYDIVIGFTALPGRIRSGHGRVDEIGNCRDGLGNYVAISATETLRSSDRESLLGNSDVLTLIHELGHLFGAEHVDDRSSLMAVHFKPFTDFDPKNREIILNNKFCRFRKS
jgi:predicted Zn-dependent protease